MTAASRISARDTLRAATREDHARVDALPRMQRLLEPGVSVEDYAVAIARLYQLHETLCEVIPTTLGTCAHSALSVEDLMVGLRRDRQALKIEDHAPVPAENAPSLSTAAHALGAWYVLEGAALGGALIARHLRRHLGEGIPLAHFGRAGDGRWPRFLAHLEQRLDSRASVDAAIEGASLAYRYTEQVLKS